MEKQREQVKQIQILAAQANSKRAKYYTWGEKNKAFRVKIRQTFIGYFKTESDAQKEVARLRLEKPELFPTY